MSYLINLLFFVQLGHVDHQAANNDNYLPKFSQQTTSRKSTPINLGSSYWPTAVWCQGGAIVLQPWDKINGLHPWAQNYEIKPSLHFNWCLLTQIIFFTSSPQVLTLCLRYNMQYQNRSLEFEINVYTCQFHKKLVPNYQSHCWSKTEVVCVIRSEQSRKWERLTSPGNHPCPDPHQTVQSQGVDLSAHTPMPDEDMDILMRVQTGQSIGTYLC